MTDSQAERTFSAEKPNMKAKKSIQKALPGKLALLAAMLSLALVGGPGLANESDEVQKLIQRGQLEQALTRTEAFLANRPNDPQMRFLKALILTERNRTNEAIAVFTKLTEDFPELPEPYNNLAVLYAGRGEFDKARDALEMAIRTHPSYATAHENLGDIYAKMASQSYDKALQLDTRNQTAQTKLALVRNLVGGKPTPGAAPAQTPTTTAPSPAAVAPQTNQPANQSTALQAPVRAQAAAKASPSPLPSTPAASPVVAAITPPQPLLPPITASTPKAAPPTPSVVKRDPPRETPRELPRETLASTRATNNNGSNTSTASGSPSTAPKGPVVSSPPVVTRPAPAPAATTPPQIMAQAVPKPTSPAPSRTTMLGNDTQVLDAVQRWAKAWASQDITTYLDAYSKSFAPPNRMSRANWEKQREERIVGKGSIRVVVENPQISMAGDQAVVKFKQRYYSDKLTNISIKILNMRLENGVWRIVSERVEG